MISIKYYLNEEEITKDLQTTFIPDKRQAAELKKAKNETDLEEKIDEAIGVLKACSTTGTTTIQTATAARKALREINAGPVAANKGLLVNQSCINEIKQTDEPAKIAKASDKILSAVTSTRSCLSVKSFFKARGNGCERRYCLIN